MRQGLHFLFIYLFIYYMRDTFKMLFKYYMPKIRINLTKISISPHKNKYQPTKLELISQSISKTVTEWFTTVNKTMDLKADLAAGLSQKGKTSMPAKEKTV